MHAGIKGAEQVSTMLMLSTASSFLTLGVKLSKVPLLKAFVEAATKQKKALQRVKLRGSAATFFSRRW